MNIEGRPIEEEVGGDQRPENTAEDFRGVNAEIRYDMPENILVNGFEISLDRLKEFTGKEHEQFVGTTSEMARTAEITIQERASATNTSSTESDTENAPNAEMEAKRKRLLAEAKTATVVNSLIGGDPELATKIEEAKRDSSREGGRFLSWLAGKKDRVVGPLAAALAMGVAGAAYAGNADAGTNDGFFKKTQEQAQKQAERQIDRSAKNAGRDVGRAVGQTIEDITGAIRRSIGLETPQERSKRIAAEKRAIKEAERAEQAAQRAEEKEAKKAGDPAIAKAREERQFLELNQLDKEWGERISAAPEDEQAALKIQWLKAKEEMLQRHNKEDARRN